MKKHQTYNDGVARFYTPINDAENGERPDMVLGNPFLSLRYQNRTVGLRRMAAIKELGQKVDNLIRVQASDAVRKVSTQTVCVTSDGARFDVKRLQDVTDATPRSVDIYLERTELP